MLYIKCNDDFYLKGIIDLFLQKNFIINENENYDKTCQINIDLNTNSLILKADHFHKELKLPTSFQEIFKNILSFASDINFSYEGLNYFPIKQLLSKGDRQSILKDIHNIIFSNLYFKYPNYIDKVDLYKKIWPSDKDVFINKLDTHLTNLKNQLIKDLNYELRFTTNTGKIKLIIN